MKPRRKDFLTTAENSFSHRALRLPHRPSFEQFLLTDARVPSGHGLYKKYSFKGREALLAVVRTIDRILGSAKLPSRGSARSDSELSLAGGAQFGKTILELNLAAYLTGQQFRNFGLYLPDDDLVEGIVDSKFRPNVVDQIAWFAEMVQVGKALNRSGKAVNRKGAFLVTDGHRRAVGMIRGLGKVPTAFSMDAALLDEVDDLKPRLMKFVRGRLTASDLRFILKIGTQRIHGRGMNKAWKDGSQGVFIFKCPNCHRPHNPEEEFPQIIRLRPETDRGLSQSAARRQPKTLRASCFNASTLAPKLTWSGDFKRDGSEEIVAAHDPQNQYYLACVECGTALDRTKPIEEHRQPALIKQRQWSFRISQLAIAAIDLSHIVARFQSAVADPEEMVVFRCDVLALPQSTAQALTPAILDRTRSIAPYDLAPLFSLSSPAGGVVPSRGSTRGEEAFYSSTRHPAFAGLDMGDRCWLFARELIVGHDVRSAAGAPASSTARIDSPISYTRLLSAQKIPAADIVAQAQIQFHRLGLSALFIDERPLVNEARTLALALNGLQSLTTWPRITNENLNDTYITLPGGLTWDGRNSRWQNLKCALVRFTKTKLGAGIQQTMVFFEEAGQTKFVPCIACNRFETIDRVIREFLTPAEGVLELSLAPSGERAGVRGQPHISSSSSFSSSSSIRETPAMLLPRLTPNHPPILATLESHLLTGSERLKETDGTLGDYANACENHLLLANAYSALAALLCHPAQNQIAPPPMPIYNSRLINILTTRADRSVLG